MIKQIAQCPYCRAGVIGLDYEAMELIYNPDRALQEPCEHLGFIHGVYSRGAILANGARRVGVAQLHWRHASFADCSPNELSAWAETTEMSEVNRLGRPGEQAWHIERLEFKESQELSGQAMVRWLDQVGWDRASEDELPYEEHQATGWVVFARHPAELLALLPRPATCQAS